MNTPSEFRPVIVLFAAASMVVAACAAQDTEPGAMDSAQANAATAEITSADLDVLRSAFLDAMEANDFATAAGFYAEDAVFHHADGTKSRGRAEIQQHLTASGEGVTMTDVSLTPTDMGGGARLAWETGTFSGTITPQGGEPMAVSSNYLVVVERQPDGSLLLVQDAEWAPPGEGGGESSM